MLQATYVDDVFLFPHVTIQMVTEPMTKRVMAKKTTDGGFFCSWEGRVDYERQQDFSRVLFSSTNRFENCEHTKRWVLVPVLY